MVLEKRKVNLLINSVVCSCFCSYSALHYFIWALKKENKNGDRAFYINFIIGSRT